MSDINLFKTLFMRYSIYLCFENSIYAKCVDSFRLKFGYDCGDDFTYAACY